MNTEQHIADIQQGKVNWIKVCAAYPPVQFLKITEILRDRVNSALPGTAYDGLECTDVVIGCSTDGLVLLASFKDGAEPQTQEFASWLDDVLMGYFQ